jgi:pimeloyl-ACP methyl ester carboxylesterase
MALDKLRIENIPSAVDQGSDQRSTAYTSAIMSANRINVVFAHGAWADGSSWAKVIASLKGQGFPVAAAPLPLSSMSDDVAALDRVVERMGGPVLLVGHAYAGAVIGATRSENVKSLVYVAGLAPDEGETVADVFYRVEPHPRAPKLAPDRHGFIWLPESAFAEAFAPNASTAEAAVLAAIQRPINVACISVKMGRPLWRDRPAWYLIAQQDRMIRPETQQFMAERMKATVKAHSVDHTPSITAPDVVVSVVLEAATAAGR